MTNEYHIVGFRRPADARAHFVAAPAVAKRDGEFFIVPAFSSAATQRLSMDDWNALVEAGEATQIADLVVRATGFTQVWLFRERNSWSNELSDLEKLRTDIVAEFDVSETTRAVVISTSLRSATWLDRWRRLHYDHAIRKRWVEVDCALFHCVRSNALAASWRHEIVALRSWLLERRGDAAMSRSWRDAAERSCGSEFVRKVESELILLAL